MEKTFYDYYENTFSSYDGETLHANMTLESAILEYTEFVLTEHYVTESVNKNLWTKVKQFFTKIILAMKNFMKDLDIQIQSKIREKELKKTLEKLKEEIRTKESLGEKTIQMIDFWKYKNLYLSLNRELYSYAKKFAKVKYTKVYQIEDDLNEFNEIVSEYSEKMKEVSTLKIDVPVKKALNFVESELQGRSEVLKTLNDSMTEFHEIQQIAENMQTKMMLLGNDIIPKHIGFIQKMVNAISTFIRKWTTRFIVGVVLLFA